MRIPNGCTLKLNGVASLEVTSVRVQRTAMKNTAIFLLSATWLIGCNRGDTLAAAYVDYAEFLAESSPVSEPFQIKNAALPSPKVSRLVEPDIRISLGDVVSWSDCQWGGLLFERTGGMGKVMPATREWVHGARLVTALQRCAEQHKDEEESFEKLMSLAERKSLSNAVHWWNMLWGSPEWQTFLLTNARGFLRQELLDGEGLGAMDDLDELLAWNVSLDYDLAIGRLEHALGALRRSRLGYKWVQGATMSLHALEWIRANHLAVVGDDVSDDRCHQLNRAFHKYFLRGVLLPTTSMVQVGTRLDEQSARFLKRSLAQEEVWEQLQPQARAFISSRGWAPSAPEGTTMSARIGKAVKDHVQEWTRISKVCGFELALE